MVERPRAELQPQSGILYQAKLPITYETQNDEAISFKYGKLRLGNPELGEEDTFVEPFNLLVFRNPTTGLYQYELDEGDK